MALHAQNKGKSGEREIAKVLNDIIRYQLRRHNLPVPDVDIVQRNQNQSAVGGNDLTNCFGLSIEVKRQEQLSINSWWKQCIAAAERNNEWPVLIYRQNRKPWRVVTLVDLRLPTLFCQCERVTVKAEMDMMSFENWFNEWVNTKLTQGEVVNV